jgi:hypothetical protein
MVSTSNNQRATSSVLCHIKIGVGLAFSGFGNSNKFHSTEAFQRNNAFVRAVTVFASLDNFYVLMVMLTEECLQMALHSIKYLLL